MLRPWVTVRDLSSGIVARSFGISARDFWKSQRVLDESSVRRGYDSPGGLSGIRTGVSGISTAVGLATSAFRGW
jgi:hypothetical protein